MICLIKVTEICCGLTCGLSWKNVTLEKNVHSAVLGGMFYNYLLSPFTDVPFKASFLVDFLSE